MNFPPKRSDFLLRAKNRALRLIKLVEVNAPSSILRREADLISDAIDGLVILDGGPPDNNEN